MTSSPRLAISAAMNDLELALPPLPEPDLVSCLVIDEVQPHMLAMRLNWPDDVLTQAQIWDLPGGQQQFSPAPECFGIVLHRSAEDAYVIRLWWDGCYFTWQNLTRQEIENTCLHRLLAALGSDLPFMLEQPILDDLLPTPLAGRAA